MSGIGETLLRLEARLPAVNSGYIDACSLLRERNVAYDGAKD
jgi:hypothetical protein